MQKKPALWLALMFGVLLPLIAACGSNILTGNSNAAPTVPPGESLYVLDGYTPLGSTSTGQHIVAFHPEGANPSMLVSLPAGLISQDHQRVYTATAQNGLTTISIVNSQTGTTIHRFVIPGTYSAAGQDYDASVISANGQWLALRQFAQSADMTTIALVDTQAGKLVKTINLDGEFTLDAISPAGKALYLLEKLKNAPGHYHVRAYEVDENKLFGAPVADKTTINAVGDANMTGTALARQVLNGGTFAYTLYIDTLHNLAFVHILPLNDALYPPVARCIDLPVGKSADLLHYYTLALSSDGKTLYAANGALGVVSSISLNNSDPTGVFGDKIENTGRFNPGDVSMSSSDKTRMFHNGAVISSDQKTLYFAGLHGLWVVNTSDLHVQNSYLTQQAFTGVALSADNRTLYGVDPVNGITLLSVTNGQTRQVSQSPAHTPWGIEWISN